MSRMRQAFGLQSEKRAKTRGGAPLAPGWYESGRWPEDQEAKVKGVEKVQSREVG